MTDYNTVEAFNVSFGGFDSDHNGLIFHTLDLQGTGFGFVLLNNTLHLQSDSTSFERVAEYNPMHPCYGVTAGIILFSDYTNLYLNYYPSYIIMLDQGVITKVTKSDTSLRDKRFSDIALGS